MIVRFGGMQADHESADMMANVLSNGALFLLIVDLNVFLAKCTEELGRRLEATEEVMPMP